MSTTLIFQLDGSSVIAVSEGPYNGPSPSVPFPDNLDFNIEDLQYYRLRDQEVYMLASEEQLELDCQKRLDAFAQTRGYDNINSACSYSNSSNPKYKLEGDCAVEKRDATWEKLYTIFQEVREGLRPSIRCFRDIIDELQTLEWPVDVSVG